MNRFHCSDPRNQGVLADEIVATSQGESVRRVTYQCPLNGQVYEFLTNADSLPPGLIAHLYRIRWDIEKTFDELKNKLGETKAWASSANAKSMQAHFLSLAHNLMLLLETLLENNHGVRNEAELKRRAQRLGNERARLADNNQCLPSLYCALQRVTQRSVKFIRWLRVQLFSNLSQDDPLKDLSRLYATL